MHVHHCIAFYRARADIYAALWYECIAEAALASLWEGAEYNAR